VRPDDALEIRDDLLRWRRARHTLHEIRSIAKEEKPAVSKRLVQIHADICRMRSYIVDACVQQHRDALAAAEPGAGKMKRDGALSTPGSAGEQMRITVSQAAKPVVEQRDSAAHDAANE
jgi:hypothetical protein